MKRNRNNKGLSAQTGYSLLELLIYIALFTIISVLLIRSLVVIMRTYASAQANRRLQNNGEVILERISREVRDAKSISSGTFSVSPGTLTLIGDDGTVSFAVVNGALEINDGGTVGALSTSAVAITTLIFRKIETPNGEGVKTELMLTTTNSTLKSTSFYSTTLLRD